MSNIGNEIFFGTLPLDGSSSELVKSFEFLVERAFAPQLAETKDWGKMLPNDKSKGQLMSSLSTLRSALHNGAYRQHTSGRSLLTSLGQFCVE
jgi:hypothetical protein